MDIVAALTSQYHASLAMLREAIEDCPEDLWVEDVQPSYWRIVYHTLFYTHFYLMPDLHTFTPWEKHRRAAVDLAASPEGLEPYPREELLAYLAICEQLVDQQLAVLDLSAPRSGFPWYDPLPKLDHQINNIRHIQHHLAVLSDRLRVAVGHGVEWRGYV